MDLTKLRALEMPKKEIEVEILGEVQKIVISAMGDNISLDIQDIREENECSEVKMRQYLLIHCAGMTEADAKLLCERAGGAAAMIANAILDLSDEFDNERIKIAQEAKKKSGDAPLTDMKE